jgi:predicted amidohydrolase YtcJ
MIFRFLTVVVILALFAGCSSKQEVDVILKNAHIYTLDNNFNVVQGAAIRDGKFIAVGPDATINARYTSDSVFDLRGKFVYPGFIDAHSHFTQYAETLLKADLSETESYEQMVEQLSLFHLKNPNSWLVGYGWDQNRWLDKKMPDNILLNETFPNNPVFLWRIDGHAALVNQKMMELAKINLSTKFEGGGIVVQNGCLTGILLDKAAEEVSKLIPLPSFEQIAGALEKAEKNCFAVGLTSVTDAGLSFYQIRTIDSLQKTGRLKIAVSAMIEPTPENIEYFIGKTPYVTERLHVGTIKLFVDGALGSRGALLLKPYSDDMNNIGIQRISKDSMLKICLLAITNNFQVAAHCIGDSANRLALNVFSSVLPEKNNLRWRIEHAQVVNPEDLRIFKKYAIIPSIQTNHYLSDKSWAKDRLGSGRLRYAYAWQDLFKQNDWLANGSDFPYGDMDPLHGFYAAVTRAEKSPVPKKQEQHLSRMQALKAMTIWAAMATFEEKNRGSIEQGKWADFVILDKNIMSIYAEEIMKLPIEKTFCHGHLVYQNKY